MSLKHVAVMALLAFALSAPLRSGPIGDAPRQAPRTPDVAWPEPPAPARIRFVRSLTPAIVAGKPRLLSRIWGAVTGGREPDVMAQPYGLTVDAEGQLLVADTYGRCVHVFDLRRSRYSRISVDADSLIGVAAAGDRVFVTDSASARVLCLNTRGRRLWSVGRAEGLQRPTGLTIDGDLLRVVDTLGNDVVTLTTAGRIVGRFGSRGAEPGQFNFPTNIARGRDGRLYVTDSMNFRAGIFSSDGTLLNSFGKLGDAAGDFHRPKGIAVDSDGHIYVVEGVHDVVQIFDETGTFLMAFGESGAGPGQLWLPTGIAIVDDFIYVADSSNQRIQVYQYLKDVSRGVR